MVPETKAYLHDDPDEHEREAFIACCTDPCQGDVALISRAETVAWLREHATWTAWTLADALEKEGGDGQG